MPAQHAQEEIFQKSKPFNMKKIISITFFLVIMLAVVLIACNKSEKVTKADTPLSFKTDLERDANSAALAKLISEDNDWKALKKLNYEFLDILVKSDVPVSSYITNAGNKDVEKLNSKIYLAKLEEAKRLANQMKNKYFQNSKQCYTCETMTEAKLKLFAEKINTFRNNKVVYNEFLIKLGMKGETQNKSRAGQSAPVDCNNWRFTLCGGACVVTAPTGIIFAACLAMCVAEFC